MSPFRSERTASTEHLLIHLASNENPLGPSRRALAAIRQAIGQSHLYPDNDARELRQRLAEHHSLRPEHVLIGPGSTELINWIARALLRPGLNAVTSERSFIVYSLATAAADGALIQAPMQSNGFDLDAIAAGINPETRIVFLANPNNPTGTLFDADAAEQFLGRVPEQVTVVLDEAYYEYAEYFARERGVCYSRSVDYARHGRNVVVLRTFSKVHGLAGLRVAYALGRSDLLANFAEVRSTYSVSLPAQAGALAALDDEAHIRESVRNNAAAAEWLTEELSKLEYRPLQTWANFVYCDIGRGAGEFARRMESRGILIRPLGPWGAPNAIRVTIGTPEQNEKFLAAFKEEV